VPYSSKIIDLHLDASAEDARKLIERITKQVQEDMTPAQLARLAEHIGKRTSEFQREQLRRQLKAAVGVDPLMHEPASIAARVTAFTSENVALIKTVPQKFFGEVEQRVVSAVRQGIRADELAEEIRERYGVAASNAERIANDQIGKFFGELNRVRQTTLGIDSFVWNTVHDNRVREAHEELDGQTFTWAYGAPGEDQFPGDGVNCRCYAEPDLSSIIEEL
jgi:SPP1 gp7 family putative phage head morphogenesis protein